MDWKYKFASHPEASEERRACSQTSLQSKESVLRRTCNMQSVDLQSTDYYLERAFILEEMKFRQIKIMRIICNTHIIGIITNIT